MNSLLQLYGSSDKAFLSHCVEVVISEPFLLKIHHRDPSGSWVHRMIDPFIQFMDQLIELMIIEKSVISMVSSSSFIGASTFAFV